MFETLSNCSSFIAITYVEMKLVVTIKLLELLHFHARYVIIDIISSLSTIRLHKTAVPRRESP